MTDAPRKRPWFQFHLSTAIVMMFVAGGLLGASILISRIESTSHFHGITMTARFYGFPLPLYKFGVAYDEPYGFVIWPLLCVDVCVWLTVLLVTGFLCEWLIRRQERP
ncbi:MAG: hypothetical protein NTW87_21655 [Planctomycetota bacterium]|nr:hypothetical protein [Planctomycetota bacterium]